MEWIIITIGVLLVTVVVRALVGSKSSSIKDADGTIEALGTLSRDMLALLTQEDLDWWNQQRELMGLKSSQRKQRPVNDEMIHRVLAKAANPHGILCDCRECLRSRRLRKLDEISRLEARGEELSDYLVTLRSKILDDLRDGHEVTELKTIDGGTFHISVTEKDSA